MVAPIGLSHAVGLGAPNRPSDVALLQDLLNCAFACEPPLPVDGRVSSALLRRLERFQTAVVGLRRPDQRTDPGGKTWRKLVELANARRLPGRRETYVKIRQVSADALVRLYRKEFGCGAPGLGVFFSAMRADPAMTDLRWAAYMLATVQHETAGAFQPIEEAGKGAGRPYGACVAYTDQTGTAHQHTYYGRGYVQLTWLENYLKLGYFLGIADALATRPDKALDPAVAYRIISVGMRQGLFTGRRLAEFVAGPVCDYMNARRVVNAMNAAEEITLNAERLEHLLHCASV